MKKFHNHLNAKNSGLTSEATSDNNLKSLIKHSSTPTLSKVLHDSNLDYGKHSNSSDSISLASSQSSNYSPNISDDNGNFRKSMFNAIKSISNSASMIVSSMNTKTSKDAKSIINSQSTSDSISASVKNFLVKKSTSISIANSNYSHFNAVSSSNFSQSLANSSTINSTRDSASNAISSYQDKDRHQSEYLQTLKDNYNQLNDRFSSATKSIQTSASVSASSHVQEMIDSNLSQVMSLSSNIKQINRNTYQAINQANTSALDVIKNLRGFSKSQAASRLTASHLATISQLSQSASTSNRY